MQRCRTQCLQEHVKECWRRRTEQSNKWETHSLHWCKRVIIAHTSNLPLLSGVGKTQSKVQQQQLLVFITKAKKGMWWQNTVNGATTTVPSCTYHQSNKGSESQQQHDRLTGENKLAGWEDEEKCRDNPTKTVATSTSTRGSTAQKKQSFRDWQENRKTDTTKQPSWQSPTRVARKDLRPTSISIRKRSGRPNDIRQKNAVGMADQQRCNFGKVWLSVVLAQNNVWKSAARIKSPAYRIWDYSSEYRYFWLQWFMPNWLGKALNEFSWRHAKAFLCLPLATAAAGAFILLKSWGKRISN